ncbi:MAG: hypothetical protein JW990_05295 [Thermoleophilia bacterium]|nr:hypothetical protein [Thermoleophilia bacterium]
MNAPNTCAGNAPPSAPATTSDLELLRTFEPILRFTKGESFFPTDVEGYLAQAGLWVRYPDDSERLLVARGNLDVNRLAEPREHPAGSVEFLRFTEQLGVADSARVLTEVAKLRREAGEKFHPGIGRLARGGFIPRIFDAVYTLLLLTRGRIPSIVAGAAKLQYQSTLDRDEKYVYYGRVVRQAGWTVLQYWFFYSYNSWRSGFSGANDHEADWENVLLYLYEEDGRLHLEWAGYASHDFHGDELRRRCDDTEQFHLLDGHPVVWVGAGSHASYFQPGEYQAAITIPVPNWIRFLTRSFSFVWTQVLGQAGGKRDPARIPFVDFARGDGKRVGPGQDSEWSPQTIDAKTPWVGHYRGLWGLHAPDSVTGESAPAGPMHDPDGSPRRSWYDPLGFAGLDKEPPPPLALEKLERDMSQLETRQLELRRLIAAGGDELQSLGVELGAIETNPHLRDRRETLLGELAVLREEVTGLRREAWENDVILEALQERRSHLLQGQKCGARAHLVSPLQPVTYHEIRFNRLAEAWAALSLSLSLLAVVGLIVFAQSYLWVGLVIMVGVLLLVESIVRRHYSRTITAIAAVLAILSAVLLLVHYWLWAIVGLLVGLGLLLLVQKLRELAR